MNYKINVRKSRTHNDDIVVELIFFDEETLSQRTYTAYRLIDRIIVSKANFSFTENQIEQNIIEIQDIKRYKSEYKEALKVYRKLSKNKMVVLL